MRLDSEIRNDIEQELQSDPDIDATYIAVNVNDGIASLTGFVCTDAERRAAEAAARRIPGVLGVADEIEVRPPSADDRLDPDIARDAAAAIERTDPTIADRIVVLVAEGWVRLEGDVGGRRQSDELKAAVEAIPGVRGVVAELRLPPAL
jgi:osmotically-inducible protein OsmY